MYGENNGQSGGFGGGRRFGGNRDRGERSGDRGGDRGFFRPVKVGEEMDVQIEAVGEKGDGVAKKDGFVIFVPGVQQGDNVRVKITKVFRKMAFAEVVGKGGAQAQEASDDNAEEPAEDSEEEFAEEDSEEF